MKNIWKIGTAIFVAQLFGYYSVQHLYPMEYEPAAIMEALIASAIAIAAMLLAVIDENVDGKTDHPTIFLLATAAAVIHLPRGIIPGKWDVVAILIAFLCVFLAVMRERTVKESIVGCFLAGIPGVGTPIGAAILLYRKWQISRVTADLV